MTDLPLGASPPPAIHLDTAQVVLSAALVAVGTAWFLRRAVGG